MQMRDTVDGDRQGATPLHFTGCTTGDALIVYQLPSKSMVLMNSNSFDLHGR